MRTPAVVFTPQTAIEQRTFPTTEADCSLIMQSVGMPMDVRMQDVTDTPFMIRTVRAMGPSYTSVGSCLGSSVLAEEQKRTVCQGRRADTLALDQAVLWALRAAPVRGREAVRSRLKPLRRSMLAVDLTGD